MKHVTFITTLSPKKQYEIRCWFYTSTVLLFITITIISFFLLPQLYCLHSIKQKISLLRTKNRPYEAIEKNNEDLIQKLDLLQKKTAHINQYKQQLKNPFAHLQTIIDASSDGITITEIGLHKKEISLTALCTSPDQATVFIQKLSDSNYFSQVQLISLQKDTQEKQFRCTIKGKRINKR